MFCVAEHKWDYSTRIYRYAYSTRIYIGTLGKRPHFFLGGVLTWGRRVPASALPSWGSMPQLGNKKMYCICLSRHRALTSKCRRGDASPAGKGTLSTGEDALSAHLYIYYLEILIDFSALHAPFKEIDMVNCTLE